MTLGDPMNWRTWRDWAYAMQSEEILTLNEVIERLALEYFKKRALSL
jgi:hypothetical protein